MFQSSFLLLHKGVLAQALQSSDLQGVIVLNLCSLFERSSCQLLVKSLAPLKPEKRKQPSLPLVLDPLNLCPVLLTLSSVFFQLLESFAHKQSGSEFKSLFKLNALQHLTLMVCA